MKRGELYRVRRPPGDTKEARVFAIVGRNDFIDTSATTVICAPVYSSRLGLSTEVNVGIAEGLKHPSSLRCDYLISIAKAGLTDYVGALSASLLARLDEALRIALELDSAGMGH